MSVSFRLEADMTLWGLDVIFSFAQIAGGGYMGELTFPHKVSVGDIMRGVWRKTVGENEAFPLGNIGLEIESVKAAMREDKDGNSLVMFELNVEGVQLGVYFIKSQAKNNADNPTDINANDKQEKEEATLFLIKSREGLKIERLPGVDVKLPAPIIANLSLSLCTGPAHFTLGDKEYNYERGFGFDAYINIPDVLDRRFAYTHKLDAKKKSPSNTDSSSSRTQSNNGSAATGSQTNENEANENEINANEANSSEKPEKSQSKWEKVKKKLGQIGTIHRIGVGYRSLDPNDDKIKKVIVEIDLSVYVSKLQLSLIGLKLIIDPMKFLAATGVDMAAKVTAGEVTTETKKEAKGILDKAKLILQSLDVGLDGLAFGVDTPSFSAGGLFLKQWIPYKGKQYRQYVGGLIIKVPKVEILGIGAYGKIDGFTSLFIYAIVGFPGIGPPAFMIQKIALGFGYNRRIIIPEIDDVTTFPLVQMAITDSQPKKNPAETLKEIVPMIVKYFPPKKSSFFFALGIKFNSFKLLDGFILLIVSWGEKLRFDLIGFLSFKKPGACIQIAIKATIIPTDGIIQVDGRITDGSYIITEQARLTGGFAFYIWFLGAHAGDFVLSLGGYHPNYNVPSHYPRVPRFRLSWRVGNTISIMAEAYFAITSTHLMLGARFEAVVSAGILNATLTIYANFLMQWKPFTYNAEIGISIRGNVTLTVGKGWFSISKTFSFSLSAKARIWGPKFGGNATIKFKCFEKSIKFGVPKIPGVKRISWSEFKSDLLPPQVLSVNVAAGKMGESNEHEPVLIDPTMFRLEIESKIPISKMKQPNGKSITHSDFGIYPVKNARSAKSNFTVTVRFTPVGQSAKTYTAFEISSLKNKLPAAMWSRKDRLALNDPEKLIEAISGVVLTPQKMKALTPIRIKTAPDFTDYSHENAWTWTPEAYTLSDKGSYEPKTSFGPLREEFEEEESDFSEYALRKLPKRKVPLTIKEF